MNFLMQNSKASKKILRLTKKKFKIEYERIKGISSQNLKQYEDELIGNIILSIDNVKATDVETVSKLLSKKKKTKQSE
jgi:hypothetical protein